MRAPHLWLLVAMTGLIFVGWIVLGVAIVQQDANQKFLGAGIMSVPALLLTIRDAARELRRRRIKKSAAP